MTVPKENDSSPKLRPSKQRPDGPPWRRHMYEVIFEAETFWGRTFDLALLVVILASIGVIALETVPTVRDSGTGLSILKSAEFLFTLLFGVEYVCRLICARRPLRYMLSFWGIIDLISFLPSLFIAISPSPRQGSFAILRSVRLLRVFRVLKLWRMMSEADELSKAIWNAREKIIVFLTVVMVAVTISGTLMYHVEYDPEDVDSQFSSIPESMYWAIVTMTTVGYGDIVPHTDVGKVISAILILLGYSLIIVPSGFVSAELSSRRMEYQGSLERECASCERVGHRASANFCDRCGALLPDANE